MVLENDGVLRAVRPGMAPDRGQTTGCGEAFQERAPAQVRP